MKLKCKILSDNLSEIADTVSNVWDKTTDFIGNLFNNDEEEEDEEEKRKRRLGLLRAAPLAEDCVTNNYHIRSNIKNNICYGYGIFCGGCASNCYQRRSTLV